MVANIELENLLVYTAQLCWLIKQIKKVSRERTCSNCPYVWHDEPNQIKIAMISDEPRPAKIYMIQLCAQQRHIPDFTDVHSNQNISFPLQ